MGGSRTPVVIVAAVAVAVAAVGGCAPSRPAGLADVPVPFDPGAGVVDVSARLRDVRKKRRVPALAAAAFDSKRLLGIGAVGERKIGSGTRVTVDDRWLLASNTKPMTATLVGRLVDRGDLRWDATLESLFPGQVIAAGWRRVTVEQLLAHRGGAPSAIEDAAPQLWRHMVEHRARSESATVRKYVAEELLRMPPAETVGDFAYSNAGYMMVGAALERKTGATWEELLERELFEPLEMRACGFGPAGECLDGAPCNAPSQPLGHQPVGSDRYVPKVPGPGADNPPSLGPAGTVHCDLRSWGRFLQEHLRAARGEPTTIVRAETLRKIQSSTGDHHALGWAVDERDWAKGPVLYLQGSNTLSYSNVWIAPEIDRVLVAVSNGGSRDDFLATDDAIGVLLDVLGQ